MKKLPRICEPETVAARIPEPPERLTIIEAKIEVGAEDALFIRGQGEGLSWDKGLPLSRLYGRTWLWKTTAAKSRVIFKLLLNDQIWAKGEDLVVDAGRMIQIVPAF